MLSRPLYFFRTITDFMKCDTSLFSRCYSRVSNVQRLRLSTHVIIVTWLQNYEDTGLFLMTSHLWVLPFAVLQCDGFIPLLTLLWCRLIILVTLWWLFYFGDRKLGCNRICVPVSCCRHKGTWTHTACHYFRNTEWIRIPVHNNRIVANRSMGYLVMYQ